MTRRPSPWVALAGLALVLAGCATKPSYTEPAYTLAPAPRVVLDRVSVDRDVQDRILALNPERITDDDVRMTLAKGPTPRIVNIHGGIYPVHLVMESFSRFLMRMGYPETKIRDPRTGELSQSPYLSSQATAGEVAWFYEREGVRPMLVGHSQGGMQAVKILFELGGKFDESVPVTNPLTGEKEARTTIVDPLTGRERPVVGLVLPYTSAVGAGGAATLLPNQWNMATRLHSIPDSVEDFTGFTIGFDLIAWDFGSTNLYKANGTATVRNVSLPSDYSHVFVPNTAHLGREPKVREWINAYTPAMTANLPPLPEGDTTNILWAADVWYSIKKHWAIEAQRLIRARRATEAPR